MENHPTWLVSSPLNDRATTHSACTTEASRCDQEGVEPISTDSSLFGLAQRVLFTHDINRAVAFYSALGFERLIELGATPTKTPEPWLDHLLIAWVEAQTATWSRLYNPVKL